MRPMQTLHGGLHDGRADCGRPSVPFLREMYRRMSCKGDFLPPFTKEGGRDRTKDWEGTR